MERSKTKRRWVKMYPQDCLFGSISYQLEPAERCVWYELIYYSALCAEPGVIADKDNRPYPLNHIAGRINVPLKLLEATLKKCIAEGRIEDNATGLHIVNWKAYQSEYERQKTYRDRKAEDPSLPFEEYKEQLKGEFSEIDVEEEYKKFKLWWGEGRKPLKRPKLAFRNWLVKARQIKKEREDGTYKQGAGGSTKQYTNPEELRHEVELDE